MRKSWRWNSRFAIGVSQSVSVATSTATTAAVISTGRASRSRLMPAALNATISRSPARRPPASSTATRSAIGNVCAMKDGSVSPSSPTTRYSGTPLVTTSSVR